MKLIKDNWYKSQYNNYYKFDREENGYYYYSERIYDNKWRAGGGRVVDGSIGFLGLLEISLEEIQEYLPDNHPDRIVINNEPEDMSCLVRLLKELNIK